MVPIVTELTFYWRCRWVDNCRNQYHRYCERGEQGIGTDSKVGRSLSEIKTQKDVWRLTKFLRGGRKERTLFSMWELYVQWPRDERKNDPKETLYDSIREVKLIRERYQSSFFQQMLSALVAEKSHLNPELDVQTIRTEPSLLSFSHSWFHSWHLIPACWSQSDYQQFPDLLASPFTPSTG